MHVPIGHYSTGQVEHECGHFLRKDDSCSRTLAICNTLFIHGGIHTTSLPPPPHLSPIMSFPGFFCPTNKRSEGNKGLELLWSPKPLILRLYPPSISVLEKNLHFREKKIFFFLFFAHIYLQKKSLNGNPNILTPKCRFP